VGEEDHVKPAVEALGHLALWQISMKPGKPFAFGQVRRVSAVDAAVDSCDPAVDNVVSAVGKAKYVVGLTATPYRRDGHQPIIHLQCGPTRFSLTANSKQ
jgi:hypothetical protein